MAEKNNTGEQEHRDWVKQEFDEGRYEKKKASAFQNKFKKIFNFRKKTMTGGKFTHGTRGKSTHGPRGNQG